MSLAAREGSVERLPSSLKVGQAHIDEQRQINQVFDSRIDASGYRHGVSRRTVAREEVLQREWAEYPQSPEYPARLATLEALQGRPQCLHPDGKSQTDARQVVPRRGSAPP